MALPLAFQWIIILGSTAAWACFFSWSIRALEKREQEEITAPAFFDSEEVLRDCVECVGRVEYVFDNKPWEAATG